LRLIFAFFGKQLIEIKDKLWSSSKCCLFNATYTICIYYNKYFLDFNKFYYYLYYYQNALQTPTQHADFTRRLYSVHAARPQRAHDALEDPTSFPQRSHSALSDTLWKRQAVAFIKSMLKTNAVRTPLWCDIGFIREGKHLIHLIFCIYFIAL